MKKGGIAFLPNALRKKQSTKTGAIPLPNWPPSNFSGFQIDAFYMPVVTKLKDICAQPGALIIPRLC